MLRQYKDHSSDFQQWDQRHHATEYLLFPKNIGSQLSIDEVALSKGELVSIVTNKAGKGKKGSLVALIQGTRTVDIVAVLNRIPDQRRCVVEEVTMDMAKNMEAAIRKVFPNACRVTDHFHVSQLVNEVVQSLRIKQRWMELDREAEAIKNARKRGVKYRAEELWVGETPKQLLARSRYILYKNKHTWTSNQKLRSFVLFHRYPHLKTAYDHGQQFLRIYRYKCKRKAEKAFNKWINKTYTKKMEDFYSCARSLIAHNQTILNFFDNRSTNASAESFNAKIKGFRAVGRGVSDHEFFLFRLTKLFA
jgi:transposase